MTKNAARVSLRYQYIYEALRSDILSGAYRSGDPFPTEYEIMARFDASRTTVRSALRLLHEEGLIISRRGSGTTVTLAEADGVDRRARFTDIQDVDFNFSCDMPWEETASEPIIDRILASPTVARELEIHEGTEVYRIQWRLAINGAPYNYLTHYVRTDLFPDLETHIQGKMTSFYRMAEAGYGLIFTEAREDVVPICANFIQASFLNVAEGTPLLKLSRTARCQKGVLEYSETVLNPQLIQITFAIGRRNM